MQTLQAPVQPRLEELFHHNLFWNKYMNLFHYILFWNKYMSLFHNKLFWNRYMNLFHNKLFWNKYKNLFHRNLFWNNHKNVWHHNLFWNTYKNYSVIIWNIKIMDLKRIGLAIGLSSIAYDDVYFQFSTFQCELLKYFRVRQKFKCNKVTYKD